MSPDVAIATLRAHQARMDAMLRAAQAALAATTTAHAGSLISEGPGPSQQLQARGAALAGMTYGLIHVISPDDLATLTTLSSLLAPARAARVGAAFGLGHSIGIAVMAGIFLVLRRLFTINTEEWENVVNYLIGASLMAIGLYFLSCEASFMKELADGAFEIHGCACHGTQSQASAELVPAGRSDCSGPCCVHGPAQFPAGGEELPCLEDDEAASGELPHMGCSSRDAVAEEDVEVAEVQPLLAPPSNGPRALTLDPREEQSWWQLPWSTRDTKGAVLGVFQGLCCPVSILCLGFLAKVHGAGVAVFLIVFMLMLALGSASVAVLWALLTSFGVGTNVSPRSIYRASCGLTFALGVAWITCNAFGLIGMLDYTEGIEGSQP